MIVSKEIASAIYRLRDHERQTLHMAQTPAEEERRATMVCPECKSGNVRFELGPYRGMVTALPPTLKFDGYCEICFANVIVTIATSIVSIVKDAGFDDEEEEE
jgi:hypothetical protein